MKFLLIDGNSIRLPFCTIIEHSSQFLHQKMAESSSRPFPGPEEINELSEARAQRKKQQLAWLKREMGTRWRLRVHLHAAHTTKERRGCQLCNVKKSWNKGGIKVHTMCNACTETCARRASSVGVLPDGRTGTPSRSWISV